MKNFYKIVEFLKVTHSGFVKKYETYIKKNLKERMLERELVYAKLDAIGKAFVEAGIIEKYEEAVVAGTNRNMVFLTDYKHSFYFLNGVDKVVFMPGNALLMDSNKNTLILPEVHEGKNIVFKNVLSDDFDWLKASKEILELIHEDAYLKTEVLNDYIDHQFSIRPNSGE